ncbi:MAG: tRNA dihydrouridine synthase DusB [Treponema sp.]|jgi:nifR3 family TIM-barrel protein|nr:tRNA dihydrouridine synthase DusB [Treponema sp.]
MNLYHPVTIGSLSLNGNLFLAPVAGYSDRAFRAICVEQGAGFTSTELISAESVIRNRPDREPAGPAATLLRRADNERHYAIQLFGAYPERIYEAAVLLAPWKPDAVDINSGCPVPKVTKTGSGSALMKNPDNLGRVVEAAVKASREYLGNVPVTIKMRSGWDSSSINYVECARIAVEAGAVMVSLHPRTRAQGYSGKSDWSHIADLVSRLAVPVTGSGDLYAPEDAEKMLSETGCAAVMFARGAMGNPFIFSTTRSLLIDGSYTPTDMKTRLAAGFRQLELLAADIGERSACLEMRKQFCAYTKGPKKVTEVSVTYLHGGGALRNVLVHAETIEEYRAILGKYLL